MSSLEYLDYFASIKQTTEKLNNLLCQEFGFKLTRILETHASLFNRFCPYKVDDCVELKEDLIIPKDSGWYSSKHFLIKGAKAIVKSCDYSKDLFYFGLEFVDESYVDKYGQIIPVERKHTYHISEDKIKAQGNYGDF